MTRRRSLSRRAAVVRLSGGKLAAALGLEGRPQ